MLQKFFAIAVAALTSAPILAQDTRATAEPTAIPFQIETHGDVSRPVVTAYFNGHPSRMIVHSNAGFFSQLVHKDAASFGVRLTGSHAAFGIDRPGHVSSQGRDAGRVASLRVGSSEVKDASVSVFELPLRPNEHVGMLGVGWIRQNRVVLDYVRNRMIVAPTTSDAQVISKRLMAAGYVPLPMTFDPGRARYSLTTTINGVARRMTLATASDFELDTGYARDAHVRFGRQSGQGGGPTGTRVLEYRFGEPVTIRIGQWQAPAMSNGAIMDMYGYSAETRPTEAADADGGMLGTQFLQRTGAIVDFGSSILFVRR